MTDFQRQDLSGSTFDHVDLSGSSFHRVNLDGSRLRAVSFDGADLRMVTFVGTRIRGGELRDLDIHAEVVDVTINGVDIGPLLDAELDRRTPERALMRPTDPEGYAAAWATLTRLWDETVERAVADLPPETLDERVDGEWSLIETLRHLNFASAAWVGRMILGDPMPYHPLDLPWEEAEIDGPDWVDIPVDRDARPSLADVLAVRRDRREMVGTVIAGLTQEQLDSTTGSDDPGWPRWPDAPFRECLQTVIVEEWEHRSYAERDLAVLRARHERPPTEPAGERGGAAQKES